MKIIKKILYILCLSNCMLLHGDQDMKQQIFSNVLAGVTISAVTLLGKNVFDRLKRRRSNSTKKVSSEFVGQDGLSEKLKHIINNSMDDGVTNTTGILLYGPPGTGKTELAKHIAEKFGIKYEIILPRDLSSRWVGETEKIVADRLEDAAKQVARKKKPYLLIIDECDQILSSRREPDSYGDEQSNAVKNTFLQYFEGFYSTPGLVILGITNNYNWIDPAFLRPGRFTHQFKMDMPSLEDKKKIFDFYKQKYKVELSQEIDPEDINELLDLLTPADIKYFLEENKSKIISKEILGDTMSKKSVVKKLFFGYKKIKDELTKIIKDSPLEDNATGIIICGPKDSGKKTLVRNCLKEMKVDYSSITVKKIHEKQLEEIKVIAKKELKKHERPYAVVITNADSIVKKIIEEDQSHSNPISIFFKGFDKLPGLVIICIVDQGVQPDAKISVEKKGFHIFSLEPLAVDEKIKIAQFYKKKYQKDIDIKKDFLEKNSAKSIIQMIKNFNPQAISNHIPKLESV
jgi:SpoVK/Ycf46/Vps4 family AAA+-type ATPase